MLKTTKQSHWITSLLAIVTLAGFTSICQAQDPINISFDTGVPSQFYDGGSPNNPGGSITNYWQSTGGPDGSGCEVYTIDGAIDQEIDPAFNVSFNTSEYATITFQLYVAASSGTIGTPPTYGHMQLSVRDASYSWNGEGYQALYPVSANAWVTYTVSVPANVQAAHLQIQVQGGGAYSGPVTIYIGNVSVLPPPNPLIYDAFTSQDGGIGTWDTTEDAPFYNPVNGSGPTNFTPAGSWEIQIDNTSSPGGYNGWNQYAASTIPLTSYGHFGLDVYLDGSSGTSYGGFQILFFGNATESGWGPLQSIGSVNFNSSMVGKWTHFDFNSAAMGAGYSQAPAFSIQGTPGTDVASNLTTFHVDNLVLWTPEVRPRILSLAQNATPGGLKIAVDGDASANEFDQEGITTPSATNNVADFFWVNQTPATYSFTLTNFPAPAAAPGFEAHAYVINGDSIINDTNEAGIGYQETYSGPNFNALDCIVLQVENGTNGGVNANLLWKTNTPNSNVTNGIFCNLTNLASANGNWALNFSDNTHASITLNGTAVTNFTLPDFYHDPNYNANFTPPTPTSFVQFGVWKGDSNTNHPGMNDNQSAIFTSVLATNTTVAISDNFTGSTLTSSNAWQVAEYYQDAANRTTLIPAGTAFWLTWNTAQAGYAVQSSTDLMTWTNAGVSFTYVDGTGTNTIGAIPSSALPPGGADFFDLLK